jgi:alanine dehydrogenase
MKMTLILSNDEVDQLLPMQVCLERLEETYAEVGSGRAVSRPRSDIYGAADGNGRYVFKTMDGIVPKFEVAAIRLNSDIIQWNVDKFGVRKDKQPLAPGGTWVGLVLLFSTRTGEPLAIMPDGVMQRLRVAATNALGVKYMAEEDASVYALLGSGWQAGAQAIAVAAVRPLKEIRVYSPTRDNRERLALELRTSLGIQVTAVDDPRSAVDGADIVGAATNSITPVVELEWLKKSAHVTCVKVAELGAGILENSGQVAVHTRLDRPTNYIVGQGEHPIYGHDPHEGLTESARSARTGSATSEFDLTELPDLGDLVSGRISRAKSGSLTTFVNTLGTGVQFAALGSLAYKFARERGLGREIPTEWLVETVHP